MTGIINALADVPATTIWAWSLVAGVVVILIVAALLIAIIIAANRIDYHARELWEAGKEIAGNTVSIWMLQKTNQVAGGILEASKSIVSVASSIDQKLGK